MILGRYCHSQTLYVLPQIHCLSVVCPRGESWQCDDRASWLLWSWRGPKHLRTNKKWKSSPQEGWEDVCKSEKGQVSRIHRELLQCNLKKTKTQFKIGQMIWIEKKNKQKRRFCPINSSTIILTKPQREWTSSEIAIQIRRVLTSFLCKIRITQQGSRPFSFIYFIISGRLHHVLLENKNATNIFCPVYFLGIILILKALRTVHCGYSTNVTNREQMSPVKNNCKGKTKEQKPWSGSGKDRAKGKIVASCMMLVSFESADKPSQVGYKSCISCSKLPSRVFQG